LSNAHSFRVSLFKKQKTEHHKFSSARGMSAKMAAIGMEFEPISTPAKDILWIQVCGYPWKQGCLLGCFNWEFNLRFKNKNLRFIINLLFFDTSTLSVSTYLLSVLQTLFIIIVQEIILVLLFPLFRC